MLIMILKTYLELYLVPMLVLPKMKTLTMAIRSLKWMKQLIVKKETCEVNEHNSFESKAGSTKRLKGNAA